MAQYQEGQYISQFLNTLPQQLLQHSQYKEGQRQFDSMQSLRERAEAREQEMFDYNKEQKSLLSLAIKSDREIMNERYDAEARKTKALENRSIAEKLYTKWGDWGMPMWTPQTGLEWAETSDQWAQRTTGYDPWDERFRPRDIPEGLEIDPQMYQTFQQYGGYTHPRRSMLNMAYGMGGQ